MRIAFIIGSLTGGGAERVVSMLANEYAERDHDVSIISIASDKVTYDLSEKVNLLFCINQYSLPGVSFARRVNDIRKTLQCYRPDVVLSFTVAVNIYSILASVGQTWRLIICERNDPNFDPQSKILRLLRRIAYGFADGYVFQTIGERDFFSTKIRKKSWVIPNPINSSIKESYKGDRQKRFVTAVRLEPQKNLKLAIDAFSEFHEKHNNFTFDIYGDGNQYEYLQRYISEKNLKDSVNLRGRSNTLYKDIENAYAFVLSSDYEGMSNSMLEAMALGLPVISTDYPSGGARMVINSGTNGILVPVRDKNRLVEAMGLLADDMDMARRMGEKAEKIRKELSVKRVLSLWDECIFGA